MNTYNIIKRNGAEAPFDLGKIKNAIKKAFDATRGVSQDSVIEVLSIRAVADAEKKISDGRLGVEDIQDSVEKTLSDLGYADVAKAYILYRKQREKMRNASATLLNYKEIVDNYLRVNDWRVKENSTVTYSVGGLILSNSGAITANYWLSEVYDDEIANAHRSAAIHLHDLSMLTGYCAGWSLRQLIREGLGGVPGRITSSPASHLSTLCNQMVNFLGIMQNEWAGAQAFSSFDTYLAPFVKVDNLTYREVKQCVQSFIFGVNTPSRWGTQAPFSNITLDWVVPPDMKDMPAIVGGKDMDFTYGDCQKEMDMVNKAFIEIMLEGDANGRGFQYPIPTYSITRDFDWSDTENNRLLFEMTAKYGTPYFSNYINSDMEPSDVRSMCPLHGKERVLVRDDYTGEFHVAIVENLFKGNKKEKVYDIVHNGRAKKARLNSFAGQTFFRVTTANGQSVVLSAAHANLVLGGAVKRTDDLTEADYLPFNTVPLDGSGLSYEDGYMVGAFMGDGSTKDQHAVVYSLNDDSKKAVLEAIRKIAAEKFGARISIAKITNGVGSNGCLNVSVTSRMLRGLIDEYVSGKGTEKELSAKCVGKTMEFRKGILDGYMATDGGTKQRIYSASKKAVDSLVAMLASMGIPAKVSVDERGAGETLSDNPVYSVRPYQASGQPTYGDVYVKRDGYMWFRITGIEKIEAVSTGYCFEVLGDDEPYFMLPSGLVTHNCRLRLDLRELRKKSGGFFGSGESTGSVGVVTINLPRIAYLAKDEADFYHRLDHMMDVAARSLKVKRTTVTKLLEAGLYPYTKRYLGTFANHFSTIGLIGMNEVGLNAKWLREDLTSPRTQAFAKDVLNHMRERLADYQELYGDLYNLEATPAESTTYRFAKHDKERYPHIITANENGTPYYTNSSHLPVGYTDDIFSALDIQDELQTLYTSGTVFHAFLGEKLPDWKAAAALVRKIAENYQLPYYTMSPTYSVCADHGYLVGEQAACPHCGKKTEIYSRITGYYRPVQNWNDGKIQEFKDRRVYVPTATATVKHDNYQGNKGQRLDVAPPEVVLDPSILDAAREGARKGGEAAMEPAEAPGALAKPLLFTTPSCHNCRAIKAHLAALGVEVEVVDAVAYPERARRYGVQSVPTVVATDRSVHIGPVAVQKWAKAAKVE